LVARAGLVTLGLIDGLGIDRRVDCGATAFQQPSAERATGAGPVRISKGVASVEEALSHIAAQ
jgi:hypothetical protein